MNITVNGESHQFKGKNLSDLIAELNLREGGFAVAVGQNIIPRAKHSDFYIKDNDEITIITATHGG